MPRLIVSSWLPNGSREIAAAAGRANWKVTCLEDKPLPDSAGDEEPVYYGATDVALQVSAKLDLALIEPTFDLLARMPRTLTQREIRYGTVGDARRLERRVFVKPADAANKCLTLVFSPAAGPSPSSEVLAIRRRC